MPRVVYAVALFRLLTVLVVIFTHVVLICRLEDVESIPQLKLELLSNHRLSQLALLEPGGPLPFLACAVSPYSRCFHRKVLGQSLQHLASSVGKFCCHPTIKAKSTSLQATLPMLMLYPGFHLSSNMMQVLRAQSSMLQPSKSH